MTQTQSLYVRPSLKATAAGQIDPNVEVELRLNDVNDALAGREPASESLRAYYLLALWAWYRRVNPELVNALDREGIVGKLNQYVDTHGRKLVRLSRDVFDPEQWLVAAKQLAASWEEDMPGEERTKMSDELISEFDDADLWCYAANRFGATDHMIPGIGACGSWFRENASEFLAASWYVQSVAMAFRPNLAKFDADLAKTADKFGVILDEAERAEKWLYTPVRDRMDPRWVRQVRAAAAAMREQPTS